MKLEVVDYNPIWSGLYEQDAERIKKVLGGLLLEIHHIGSTSVNGLKAKPIIDIMPVVKDIVAVDLYNGGFGSLGYEGLGEFGIPGRRYFRKGGEHRTHQIHIFEQSNRMDIERHLAVRDYLRTHPVAANEYGALKSELAMKYPDDIEGYCDGKDAFVKRMEQEALAWYRMK